MSLRCRISSRAERARRAGAIAGRALLVLWVSAVAFPPSASAAPQKAPAKAAPAKAEATKVAIRRDNRPLPPGEKAAVVHAPYGAGDCALCHTGNDRRNPGPLVKKGNAVCFDCHQEFEEILARKYRHAPAVEACWNCHNPHDSKEKKLLHAELSELCFGCHAGVKKLALESKVRHGAVTAGRKCASCHDPHAANVEKMLTALPFDLCVECHGRDDIKDWNGVSLANVKKLLAENKVHHGPVGMKDCASCHRTHGGDNFRLLVAPYPARFYAAYDKRNYELCFACHDERVAAEPETTSLTGFRDGARNLHYVHVNKSERGRTCRACHEVHASKQDHQLRDAVPYGPRGWMLKVNYVKTATGGSCAKTCHDTKTYVNKAQPKARK